MATKCMELLNVAYCRVTQNMTSFGLVWFEQFASTLHCGLALVDSLVKFLSLNWFMLSTSRRVYLHWSNDNDANAC